MNYKLFLLLILSIFLIKSSFAFIVTPSVINIDNAVGISTSVNLTIFNDNNFSLYNINFEANPYFSANTIDQLNPNETREITATITTDSPIHTSQNIKLMGNFVTTLIYPPEIHGVEITRIGYVPQNIQIKMGSSILYSNTDSLTHTITSDPIGLDTSIPPNGTATYQFNSMGDFDIWDRSLLFHQIVTVINNTYNEYTHNDAYDSYITVNIDSSYSETSLTFDLIDTDFTIDYNGVGEGLLRLFNSGNQTGRNITLASSSEWVSFQENNFNLDIGNQNYVQFLITPLIESTNQTNQSYSIGLTASGSNLPAITKNINLNIPYYDVGDYVNYTDREELIRKINELRKLLADFNLSEEQQKEIIYVEREFNYSYTGAEMFQYLTEQTTIKDELNRIGGDVIPVLDFINNKFPSQFNEMINLYNKTLEETEKTRKTTEFMSFIGGSAVVILGLFGIITFILKKQRKKKIQEQRLLG